MDTLGTSPIEKCLHVGQQSIFYPESQRAGKQRLKAVIRGWQTGVYILLEVQLEHERSLVFQDGAECSLRFLHEGVAYAIESNLLSWQISRRDPNIRISWPRSLRSAAIRRHERIEVNLPCTLRHEDKEIPGIIGNLSAGGCGITADCNATPGSHLAADFSLPDGIPIAAVPILVRASKALKSGSVYLGCSFRQENHAGITDIAFYVGTSVLRMRQQAGDAPRFLVVGRDNEAMARVRESLDATKCLAMTATSLLDALVHARLTVPAFILLEYDWSGPTALDACRILRASPAHRAVPIFVFGAPPAESGGPPADGLREKVIKAGGTDYFAELPPASTIASLLENHHAAGARAEDASARPANNAMSHEA